MKNICTSPQMTAYLVGKDFLKNKKFTLVDVGARAGGAKYWNVFKDQIKLIGFDPDEEECKKLNEKYNKINQFYFPLALGKKTEIRDFYLANYPSSSSFYQPNLNFWSRFVDDKNIKTISKVKLKSVDFNNFAQQEKVQDVDFLKVDVEGAEMDVLQGADKYLNHLGFLGAEIEVRFQNCAHQPVFNEIDFFMRAKGYRLFDIDIYRSGRKSLPEISPYRNSNGEVVPGPSLRGQVNMANVLYLRDIVAELQEGNNNKYDQFDILKLACLFELFSLSDCAIELLQKTKKTLKNIPVDHLIDLLTPPFRGKQMAYAEYLQKIEEDQGKEWEGRYLLNNLKKDILSIGYYYTPKPLRNIIVKTLKN